MFFFHLFSFIGGKDTPRILRRTRSVVRIEILVVFYGRGTPSVHVSAKQLAFIP